jgi:hypothetical protein
LNVEGSCRDGILTLNLTYETYVEGITENAYLFNFDKESIDLVSLQAKVEFVTYKDQQIPVKEFVRDAMTPVVETIGKRLGGSLRIGFFPDGSTEVSIGKQGTGGFTPVVGKHGYYIHHQNNGYLFADTEGASWINKAVLLSTLRGASSLYGWYARDKHFIPLFYSFGRDISKPDEKYMMIALEDPTMTRFGSFFSFWLDCFGNNVSLSEEETEKCGMVLRMLNNEEISFIGLMGTKIH